MHALLVNGNNTVEPIRLFGRREGLSLSSQCTDKGGSAAEGKQTATGGAPVVVGVSGAHGEAGAVCA